MIYLDSPTKSLMVTLDAIVAANQVDVSANFFDITPQSTTSLKRGGVQVSASNNTSDVTMVSPPAVQGIVRNVQTIFINNKDTATRTVTVKLDDSGAQKILVKQSIAAGESLVYEDNSGWQILSPITPPFIDTTPLVKGSSDATKQVRIEVDGLTTSTTRVWTAPDADITVSGSASALTTGRVVYTTAGGLLTADANFLYNGTNITLQPSGTLTLNPTTLGNIDNTRIGFSTRAAIQATTGNFNGTLTVSNILGSGDTASAYSVGTNADFLGGGLVQLYGSAAGNRVDISANGAIVGRFSAGATALTGTLSATGHTTFEGVTSTGATGTGNLVYSASPTFTGTLTASVGAFSSTLSSTAHTVTSASASALAVGLNGATNPALQIDASTALSATGLKVKSAAAAGGLALSVITSGTNENLTIDAAGSGTITIGGTSTGAITLSRATTLSAALTYGGVALSNAVTGTGNMVLSASPTLTGTLTAATSSFSGHMTIEGVTSTGSTGTGKFVFNVSPTFTGTLAAAAETLSGSLTMTADSSGGGQFLMSDSASGGQIWQIGPGAGTGSKDEWNIYNQGTTTTVLRVGKTGTLSFPAALTYGGVTLSNSVTGTGSMVLSAAPTFTSSITIGGAAVGVLDHGTYTPTLTSVTNIASSTAYSCQWLRVGNTVTVSGRFDYTATTGSIAAELGISLPVASNLANSNECGGTAITSTTWNAAANGSGNIQADATNDRATFKTQSANAGGATLWFQFTYRVI